MATIAIGDIHGYRRALDDLLHKLRPELGAGDTVVFLGDYIDRGPDSKGCIDSILEFRASTPASVVGLMGNHEDWMLKTMEDPRSHSWLIATLAFETIASYSTSAALRIRQALEAAGRRLILEDLPLPYDEFFDVMPPDHQEFFKSLGLFHQTDGAVFVHGGVDPAVGSIAEQKRQSIIWGRPNFISHYAGPDVVVYGHWDNAEIVDGNWPWPVIGRATVGIDTISHGVLTAFRWPDREVFQSARFA